MARWMKKTSPKVNEKTRLVAVGLASNALGTVNNVKAARELSIRRVRY